MGGNRQTSKRVGCHRQRRRSLLRPVGAVRGTIAREGVSAAHQLHPVGGAQAARCVVDGAAAGGRTVLKSHAVAWRHSDEGVDRVGIQALANHDSGLGPGINVLHGDDAGDDGAIVRHGHIHKMEGVGRVPDVVPGSNHGEHGIAAALVAVLPHRPYVLRQPR